MKNLKLYIRKTCLFCDKVLRYIKENNILNIEIIDVSENEKMEKELEEKGGKNQVPCLLIDDYYLYESLDVINYLKENIEK